jgi:hypothetical protein
MAKLRKSTTSKLVGSQNMSKTFKPVDLVSQAHATVRSTTKISTANDLKKLSSGTAPALKGIQFGSPFNNGTKSRPSASAGNEWTNLVKTASGGVASLIGGGFLESGVDSLISGITSLFDGGDAKSETPLVRFALPEPQQQTMYVTSQGLSANAPSEDVSLTASSAAGPHSVRTGGIYQSTPLQGPMYRQSEIVQAIKNALLTSSSLNDVIAEI